MKYLLLIVLVSLVSCKSKHEEDLEKMSLTSACNNGAMLTIKSLIDEGIELQVPSGVDSNLLSEKILTQCSDMYWK